MPAPYARVSVAWAGLTVAFALHVWDEAAHNFLDMYNPVAAALRVRLGGVPFPPVFTFATWLGTLLGALLLLTGAIPLVRHGGRWVVPAAYVYAGVHLLNAFGHLAISIAQRRLAPGAWSAPVLAIAAGYLTIEARSVPKASRPARSSRPNAR